MYQNLRFVTRLRGGLIALIYGHATDIRAVDSGAITAVSLMGTDVERIAQGLEMLHSIWGSLLDIGIAIWLLERQLQLACIAPVVIVAGKFTTLPDMTNNVGLTVKQYSLAQLLYLVHR